VFLCTQNVDDLHEQAGSIRVVHMHGELFKSRCDRCTRTISRHDHLRSSSGASKVRMRGQDSPAHLLVRRSALRVRSHFPRTGRMHGLHGCGDVRRGRASRELCGASRWSCADDLRWSGGTCERILVHRMPSGKGWGGVAEPAWCILRMTIVAPSRIPLWLASSCGCRDRRLVQASYKRTHFMKRIVFIRQKNVGAGSGQSNYLCV
jgi:hypothetical protein